MALNAGASGGDTPGSPPAPAIPPRARGDPLALPSHLPGPPQRFPDPGAGSTRALGPPPGPGRG